MKLVTEKFAYHVLNTLSYGITVVKFATPKAKEITEKAIELVNEITKLNLVRMRQTVDNVLVNQQYVEQAIPDTYDLIFSGKPGDCPVLTNDDFLLIDHAKKANQNKSVVTITINPGLFKMAKNIASQNGTKFKNYGSSQCFDSSTRSISVYRQIEEALQNGLDSIEFSMIDYKPQTIRVYASTINSFHNSNIKVSASNGVIIVKLNDSETTNTYIKEIYEKLVKIKGISKANIIWDSVKILENNPATRITTDEEWDEIEKEIKASKKQDDFHEIELEEIERIENENNDEIGYDYRNTIEPEHEVTPEMIDGLIMPDLSKFPQGPDIDTAPYREDEHDF